MLFIGNNVPSALHGLLRGIFGFSSLTQTLLETATTVAAIVIAAGCVVLIPSVVRRRG